MIDIYNLILGESTKQMTEDIYYRELNLHNELRETFKYHRRRWCRLLGHEFYDNIDIFMWDHVDTMYIQPSYRPHYLKSSKGKPILVINEEDCTTINEENWHHYYCKQVRNDFLNYIREYNLVDALVASEDIFEENYKHNTCNHKLVQNALSQKDVSNYLAVHENKQVVDDVSNHILSFLYTF